MRILHVFFSFNVGGAETMLIDIMNIQIREHEVSLMIINDNVDEQLIGTLDNRIKIIRLNRKEKSKNPIPILKFNWVINTLPIDIIHCHVLTISKYIFFSRKALYATKHSIGSYGSYCNKYKKIFSISNYILREILSYGNKNTILAPNGINNNLIKVKEHKDTPPCQFNIVTVGRLEHERKGQHILIEALKILVEDYQMKNIYVTIIGEGKSLGFLEECVKRQRVESHVQFLGMRDRNYIYENLYKYDIFVLPSIEEGFGLSVIEACAAKLPVLVPDIDGPMEIIENGRCGFFFKKGESLDLAKQLAYIISENKNLSDKVDLAFRKVNSEYNIEKTAFIYNNNYSI